MSSNDNFRLIEFINEENSQHTLGFFTTKKEIQRKFKTELEQIAKTEVYQYFKIQEEYKRPWVVRWSVYSGRLIGRPLF